MTLWSEIGSRFGEPNYSPQQNTEEYPLPPPFPPPPPVSIQKKVSLLAVKVGVHLKAIFRCLPPKIGLTEISRLRFKQYKNPTLITQINVLGCFVNFLVIFRYIWEEIVFLKRVVKFGEIRNSYFKI